MWSDSFRVQKWKMTNFQVETMRLDTSSAPRPKLKQLKPRRLRRQEERARLKTVRANQK
jgi:hypothetical protein